MRLPVKAVNARDKLGLPELPLMLFEFHGSPTGVKEQAEMVEAIAKEHGGQDFKWATRPEDRSRLWEARHNAYFACLNLKPGSRSFTTDVCVPISRLAECITETVKDTEASFLPAPILGHVGDGNFHCAILADPAKPQELEEAERLNQRIVSRALAADGTCTGEHGVGLHKMDFLVEEHGADAIDLMARHQARLRSAEHPQSRQDLPAVAGVSTARNLDRAMRRGPSLRSGRQRGLKR